MTQQTLILPYARTSPLQIPRRDLVLSAADSLTLRVTIVDSDNPSAQALYLTGGIGGPALQMVIWAPGTGWGCDYGWPVAGGIAPAPLWSGSGTVSNAAGSFDISIPSGALSTFPRRCAWAIQLTFDDDQADVLASGIVEFVRGAVMPFAVADTPLLTDGGDLIFEDDGVTGVDA